MFKRWPTPTDGDSKSSGSRNCSGSNAHYGVSLTDAVRGDEGRGRSWATPSAENFRTRGGDRADEMGLDNQVKQWRTPTVSDADSHGATEGPRGYNNLHAQTQNWSTPTDDDGNNATRESGVFKSLTRDVQNWSTPAAHDGHIGYQDRTTGKKGTQVNLHTEVVNVAGGHKGKLQLNPDWEETLMGWPVGWTEPFQFAVQPWPGWPMGQGPDQHDYEPPRVVPKGACPNRVNRVKLCGNGVVPQQAEAAYASLLSFLIREVLA